MRGARRGLAATVAAVALPAALSLAVSGCVTASPSGAERSATLPKSTAEERLAINAAMRDMTGLPLRATTRSFRESDTETLSWGGTGTGMDRTEARDIRRFTFRLLSVGGTCQLVHVESGERRSLPDVGCQPL